MVSNLPKIQNVLKIVKIKLKKNIRKLKGLPIIEVIGDSHALLFQSEYFNINYIGPATAYNLGSAESSNNSNKKILEILEKTIQKKSKYILFVVGEIDARIHIFNQHKKQDISVDEIIEKTVKRYINFIIQLKNKNPQLVLMICNIFPPGEQQNLYNYPYYASREIRMLITKKLNKQLKQYTQNNNILYLELFNELIDSDGNRIKKYIFDQIHYNCDILPLIIKEIKDKIPEFN